MLLAAGRGPRQPIRGAGRGRSGCHRTRIKLPDQTVAVLIHASAVETLDTYSHLSPDSDDRTREAIDTVLGSPADSPRTADA